MTADPAYGRYWLTDQGYAVLGRTPYDAVASLARARQLVDDTKAAQVATTPELLEATLDGTVPA